MNARKKPHNAHFSGALSDGWCRGAGRPSPSGTTLALLLAMLPIFEASASESMIPDSRPWFPEKIMFKQ
jgi:hypothetical protein